MQIKFLHNNYPWDSPGFLRTFLISPGKNDFWKRHYVTAETKQSGLLETDISLPCHLSDLQTTTLFALTCSALTVLLLSVFGKHMMAAVCVWPTPAHLAQHVDFIRISWGALSNKVLRWCICLCLLPTSKSMCSPHTYKEGHDYPHPHHQQATGSSSVFA